MPEKVNKTCGAPLRDSGQKPVNTGAQVTFESVFTYEHLMDSANKCLRGVRWKASAQMFEIDKMQWVSGLYDQIHSGTYRTKGFHEFWLRERGKDRFIQSVHISERCVQKCLTEYGLKPLIIPRLIYDNAASLPGKGTEFALKRLRQHLATHYRKHGHKGGILLCDYKNYFGSIRHDKLLPMLRRIIEDDRLYSLSAYFIKQFKTGGLGLGSEISQICAVYFPNDIDHYVKEKLHIRGYGRYMDDSYLIHEDPGHLKECLQIMTRMLNRIGLELNPKTHIVKFDGGHFTYLKRRFFISESGRIVTRLTRENITKRRRTVRKQKAKGIDFTQSYTSWRGYANKWNSRKTVCQMDKEVFNGQGGTLKRAG